ncbi:GTPase HflX [Alkalicoccus luteus]|uniref:GTPase HflX n=1 Tax=Alkalicoccus luteus TaxID=1237094 RepID=A0A969PL95_9BACI|nr:GTPase HflX [Alkalicoccus luteus]NJP36275.1 GTPase HflX [Alkalicoccus luteus]
MPSHNETVILTGVRKQQQSETTFEYRMDELSALTETAGGRPVARVIQTLKAPRAATYIGPGKVEELAAAAEEHGAGLIIFNDELSPTQLRNLTAALPAAVIDRTQLILDIFAQRANSREGQLQVELAQLSYTLPRLRGQGTSLSRLGGGIGTRGPGETKLETDQRHIRNRMAELRRRLNEVSSHRTRYRENRKEKEVFQIALVGYTNAGKSTLLEQLAKSETFTEDKLFATLDPLSRKVKLPSGFNLLLTDTVGFIQQLPTTLIAAFRSTLEEVREADFLLHVVDASHADADNHETSVNKLLNELGAGTVPAMTVYNKKDLIKDGHVPSTGSGNSIAVSAKNPDDVQLLFQALEQQLKAQFLPYVIRFAASEGKFLHRLKQQTIVANETFNETTDEYEFSGYVPPETAIANEVTRMRREKPEW